MFKAAELLGYAVDYAHHIWPIRSGRRMKLCSLLLLLLFGSGLAAA